MKSIHHWMKHCVPARQLLLRCSRLWRRASLFRVHPWTRTADMAQASLSTASRPHRLPVGVPEGEGVCGTAESDDRNPNAGSGLIQYGLTDAAVCRDAMQRLGRQRHVCFRFNTIPVTILMETLNNSFSVIPSQAGIR